MSSPAPALNVLEIKSLEQALKDAHYYASDQDDKDYNHIRLIRSIQRKYGFEEGNP